MPVQDELKSEHRKLKSVQEHYDKQLPARKKELEAILNNGAEGPSGRQLHQRAQAEFDDWQSYQEQFIDEIKQRIAELENQLKQQENEEHKEARAVLLKKKEEALRAWKQKGGTVESFEAAW